MKYISENWAIILIAIAGIAAAMATFFGDKSNNTQQGSTEKPEQKNKALAHTSKKLLSLVIALAAIVGIVGVFASSIQDEQQKNSIHSLGVDNKVLSMRIDSAERANLKITKENTRLQQQSNDLIKAVGSLTKQSQDLIKIINNRSAYEAEENLMSGHLEMDFKQVFQKSEFTVTVGNNPTKCIKKNLVAGKSGLFRLGNADPIKVAFDHNGKIRINTVVFDIQGNLIAEIDNNNWRPNRNMVGRFNYDSRGLEVEDNSGNIVLSIDIKENNIVIQGIFPVKSDDVIWVIGINGVRKVRIKETKSDKDLQAEVKSVDSPAKQLFQYTGNNWLHKRKKNS
jgi:hypothetical protein